MIDEPTEPFRPDGSDEIRRAGPSPVTALGHDKGMYFFLSAAGQYREMRYSELREPGIDDLFGSDPWPLVAFPPLDSHGRPVPGVDMYRPSAARRWLMGACHAEGIFRPGERLRGLGCWRGPPVAQSGRPDCELVVNCGDRIFYRGEEFKPGLRLGPHIYAAWTPVMRPASNPATAAQMADYFDFLGHWTWREPKQARLVFVGAQAAGYLVGALDWRPHVQITGPPHSGKSTLDALTRELWGSIAHGGSAPTEAFLRQEIGEENARPVIIDELEGDRPEQARAIIDLFTIASREGQSSTGRGSAGGKAQRFPFRATGYFSSNLVLKLRDKHRQRICLLELGLPPTGEAVDGTPVARAVREGIAKFGRLGPAMFKRMVVGWPRLQQNLQVFEAAMAARNANARVVDQLGTLLACAWTLLHDTPIDQAAAEALCAEFELPAYVGDADEAEERLMLNHLLSWQVNVPHANGGTQREIIGNLVHKARMRRLGTYDLILRDYGLGLEYAEKGNRDSEPMLAIAHVHRSLDAIFQGTRWAEVDRPALLRNLPRWMASPDKVSFGGLKWRATLVPYAELGLAGGELYGNAESGPSGPTSESATGTGPRDWSG